MPSISWSRIASVWLSVPLSQPPGAVAGLRFDEADIRQVLGAMRGSPVGPAAPQLPDLDAGHSQPERSRSTRSAGAGAASIARSNLRRSLGLQTSCASGGLATSSGASGLCGGTPMSPIGSARRPSTRSWLGSMSRLIGSWRSTRGRTRTPGCSGRQRFAGIDRWEWSGREETSHP